MLRELPLSKKGRFSLPVGWQVPEKRKPAHAHETEGNRA